MQKLKNRLNREEVFGVAEEKRLEVNIVIPTYNESENIVAFLDEVFRVVDLENSKRDFKDKVDVYAFVVDDNSPDGTADLVREYMKRENRVYLHFRNEKKGLGAAYKDGMSSVVKKFDPDFVFEMDADFSHDPKYLFGMIDELRNGSDFVIGSRYIKGGGLPKGWGIHRWFLSFGARTVTRLGLGLGKIKDSSGGFRGINSNVIKSVDVENLVCDGYCFQASLLEAANHEGFRIKEIPIHFNDRSKGNSKMTRKDMIEGFWLIFVVRARRATESIKNIFQNGRKKRIPKGT